jgi:HAD superfamily hydrolase (TIGR01509 family)
MACDGELCRTPHPGPRPPLPTVDPNDWSIRRRRAVRRAAGGRSADGAAAGRVAVLLLDMGGVVIPTLFESVAVAGFPDGPLRGERDWVRVERGEVGEVDYWNALAQRRPELDIATLWRQCSRVRDELRGTLDLLAAHLRVVAFTNDMSHWFGDDWRERFPELRAFDAVLEAKRLGISKPAPEAFRRAAAAIHERPDRCLLVDDLHVNLDGAAQAGMRTRLFDVRDPVGSVRAIFGDVELPARPPARVRAFASSPSAWGGGPRSFFPPLPRGGGAGS